MLAVTLCSVTMLALADTTLTWYRSIQAAIPATAAGSR
jgi:hypothetical protein